VSGLAAGGSVILNNNGGDSLTLSSNAVFTFATPVASGSSFLVTVATQPTGQTCVVNAGSGSVSTAGRRYERTGYRIQSHPVRASYCNKR
jgi:hypothetical protein